MNSLALDIEPVSKMSLTEALKLIKSEKFDLYVIDLTLRAALDGALCEAIRDIDKITPIVIFSGKSDEASRIAALSAGACAYLLKPNIHDLTRLVRQMLYDCGGMSSGANR